MLFGASSRNGFAKRPFCALLGGIFGRRKKMSEILEINDVSAGYADKKGVLKNVSLKIQHNEFFGLVGESGCGKSTLSRAIL
ncbi:MAG: ATP-binding cassette domain-containing protein, partial [Spirochaetaceae bacterium]|nr:ATP-binding cassette domain-containing protein [Spirochaetaceae bacterium]